MRAREINFSWQFRGKSCIPAALQAMMSDAMNPRKRRTALLIGAALLIAALGYGIYRHMSDGHDGELELQGNVDIRQVELGFRVGGRIAEMRAEEGDTVTQGAVLAVLDKAPYAHELAAATAQLQQAEADARKLEGGNRPQEVAQARAALAAQEAAYRSALKLAQRRKDLVESGAISKQAYDDAVSARDAAKAQADAAREALRLSEEGFRSEDIAAGAAQANAARARLAAAETALADTEILAPSDGIILTRMREAGAIVPAGQSVYTLALHRPVWVRAYVPEPELGRIKPGMKARVKSDTKDIPALEGVVGFISPQAEFTPKNIETKELRTDLVYRLRVRVDDPEGRLRQGMPVTVTLLP